MKLNDFEKKLLVNYSKGLTRNEIAWTMELPPNKIQKVTEDLRMLYKCRNTLQLVVLAIKNKQIDIE